MVACPTSHDCSLYIPSGVYIIRSFEDGLRLDRNHRIVATRRCLTDDYYRRIACFKEGVGICLPTGHVSYLKRTTRRREEIPKPTSRFGILYRSVLVFCDKVIEFEYNIGYYYVLRIHVIIDCSN